MDSTSHLRQALAHLDAALKEASAARQTRRDPATQAIIMAIVEAHGKVTDELHSLGACNGDFAICQCPECKTTSESWDNYNENRELT